MLERFPHPSPAEEGRFSLRPWKRGWGIALSVALNLPKCQRVEPVETLSKGVALSLSKGAALSLSKGVALSLSKGVALSLSKGVALSLSKG